MTAFPLRITHAQAEAIITRVGARRRLQSEWLALADCHGRVLAEDVIAPMALPAFDNSAMDGYAFRHADLATDGKATALNLVGEQFAGPALDLRVEVGQCVRITTGAKLPVGADTVVMKEDTRANGDRIEILVSPPAGAHVRRAGEDVGIGDCILRAGEPLTPTRVGLAAALGLSSLTVSSRPTVAVFTTGDELVEPGLSLRPGQIYDSNRELLLGLLRADGLEPVAWPRLPDTPTLLEAALSEAAAHFDLVLTCGAVSAGEKDAIPALLRQRGRIHFWKVRMRPGMPLLFGQWRRALVLGLPGNPVSVLATWLSLGRGLVDAMQGRTQGRQWFYARLSDGWDKRHERLEFLRGSLHTDVDGVLYVRPHPADGSHRMRGAADSDALIMLEEGMRRFTAGEVVRVWRY